LPKVTVLCARPDEQDEAVGPPLSPVLAAIRRFTARIEFVGRFPNSDIDPLLTEHVVVVGEDSQLAAVVVRLLRRGRLGSPQTGPATDPLTVGRSSAARLPSAGSFRSAPARWTSR
jgi:hypothetical protein